MPSASADSYVRKSGPLAGKKVWRGYAQRPDGGTPATRTGFPKQHLAYAWAVAEEERLVRAHELQAADAERREAQAAMPTLRQWADRVASERLWLTSEVNDAQTERDLRLYALHRWGDTRLEDLRAKAVTDWLARLVNGPGPEDRGRPRGHRDTTPVQAVSRGTALRVLASLGRLVELAVENDVVEVNRVRAAKVPPRSEATVLRWLPVPDLWRTVPHLPPWLRTPAVVAGLTGLRLGELRALDQDMWAQGPNRSFSVDRVLVQPGDKDFAWRPFPKSRLARTVPVVPEVERALAEHSSRWPPRRTVLRRATDRGAPPGPDETVELVFYGPDGLPLRRGPVGKLWETAQERAGVERKVPWHGLRHTYATLLLTQGYTLARIAALMGHSVDRTTELYGHISDTDHAQARAILSEAAGGILREDEEDGVG